MSLLDDLAEDLRADQLARAARSPSRIGTGPRDLSSLSEVVSDPSPHNNFRQFVDGGYVAQVAVQYCKGCGGLSQHLLGIFHCEVHEPSGSRRLQRLGRGAQWPLTGGYRQELTHEDVDWCPSCLQSLNFDVIGPVPALRTLVQE